MTKKTILIDVISDFVCPWCYLGRKRLIKATQQLKVLDIRISWKPFQLSPEIPKSGKPYQLHMKNVKGSKDAVDDSERTLIALGQEEDIIFDFEAITIAPNTIDAHRVTYWASQDTPETQDKLVGELFSRYFEQGQDIGNADILVDAAKTVGMRHDVVAKLLKTEIDCDTVVQDIAISRQIGVRGVPCFIMDQKFVVMGAQAADVLTDAIQQTAEGFELGTAEDR